MDDISYSETNMESVYLVGVRLFPDSREPDLYSMVLYNEVAQDDANRPLTVKGRILFCASSTKAIESLRLGDRAFRKYAHDGEIAYVYDVPTVLDLVANADEDTPGVIADFINELFDFVDATPWKLPDRYGKLLSGLADFTTFDKKIGQYLDAEQNRRRETCEALVWCIGAVVSSSVVHQ